MKKIFKIISGLFYGLAPGIAFAQGTFGGAQGKLNQIGGGTGLEGNLTVTVNSVVNIVFMLVGTIFLILMVYAGIVWIKAAGREEEVARAKKIITTSVIGLVVVLASYAVTNFILSQVTPGATAVD